jgi:hypothetical protein
MHKFLFDTTLFIIFGLLATAAALGIYWYKQDVSLYHLPPPKLTDSYGFNDKIWFANQKKAHVLCISSSMGLKHIHSNTVIQHFQDSLYLNLSAWGLGMKEIYHTLKQCADIYQPTSLIICSNVKDFTQLDRNASFPDLKRYLTMPLPFRNYFSTGSLRYYLALWPFAKKVKTSTGIHESLAYDNYGGILLDTTGFAKDPAIWDSTWSSNVQTWQYNYLDSIGKFCEHQKIKLYFFQSPVRSGLLQREIVVLEAHTEKVKQLLSAGHHYFADPVAQVWPDSLFVDGIHMNAAGAARYTAFCLANMHPL